MPESKPLVAVIMGSKSDWDTMRNAVETLDELGVPNEARVLSAHRTPDATAEFARGAADRGLRVIIAGAGGAAHLAGVIAAHTWLPVLGVPIQSKLQGLDSLLSTAQMPGGIPVDLDSGLAMMIPKGSGLLYQIHYVTTGKEETDQISVGLRFAKEPIRKRVRYKIIGDYKFKIPPGAPSWPVSAQKELECDATGVGLGVEIFVAFLAKARVSDDARPGVVVGLSVWWAKMCPGGRNANAVTSQELTDMGGGATFYDALVEVEPA